MANAHHDKPAGGVEFRGQQANALRFERTVQPQHSEPSYTLRFFNGRKQVERIDNIKESDLPDLVGARNAETLKTHIADRSEPIDGGWRGFGVLKGDKLQDIAPIPENSIEPSPEMDKEVRDWAARRWGGPVAPSPAGSGTEEPLAAALQDSAADVSAADDAGEPGATPYRRVDRKRLLAPVPARVAQRFTQGEKNQYYFDQQRHNLAFVDKGLRLETRDASPAVAESLVDIAIARGWEPMRVKGSKAFRREVWLAAELAGAHVVGYDPTEADKELLAHKLKELGVPPPATAQRAPADLNTVEPAAEAEKMAASSLGVKVLREFREANLGADWQMKADDPAVARALDNLEALAKKDFQQAVDIWNRAVPQGAERPAFVDPAWKAQTAALKELFDHDMRDYHGNLYGDGDGDMSSNPEDYDDNPVTSESINEKFGHARRKSAARGSTRMLTGRVLAHGKARFQHSKKNDMSYFVRLELPNEKEREVWGKDLARAMREAGAEVGDSVTLHRGGQKPVVVREPIHDDAGNVIGARDKDAVFNGWSVEKAHDFRLLDAAHSLEKHPDLLRAHAAMATTANALANKYPNMADTIKEKFRQRLAEKIERNEPIAVPKVSAAKTTTNQEQKRPAGVRARAKDLER
jgi:hypothetical protein